MKILAIQFKYFGDAVLLVPALRAIKESVAGCELHALVPAEVVPLLARLPGLTRVWGLPRKRGRANLRQSWPIIRALRREQFDRSVDFGANDRGAILSLLCGARRRLAPISPRGFWGRRFCYTQRVLPADLDRHEVLRNLHVLSAWQIPPPGSLNLEVHSDPAFEDLAARVLPEPSILCHLAAGQTKKEWPLTHWAALYQKASASGFRLQFSTGTGQRDQLRLEEFKRMVPTASCLPVVPDLSAFLAVLNRATLFVSGDTGPLHFAAGLGVPTVSLFGPTSADQWAPPGTQHQVLVGAPCSCPGQIDECGSASHCLAGITPERVLECIEKAMAGQVRL